MPTTATSACSGLPWAVFVALLLQLPLAASVLSSDGGRISGNDANCSLHTSEEGVIADCSGRGLSKVPQDLPTDLVSLNLSSNNLSELKNHSLSRYTNLSRLDVRLNSWLKIVESGVFEPLPHLTTLSFRATSSLTFDTMFQSLHGLKGRSLSSIDFEEAHFHYVGLSPTTQFINSTLTEIMAKVCVSHLNLAHNGIIFIDINPLTDGLFGQCIKSIDLSLNVLAGGILDFFYLYKFTNLEYISLAQRGTEPFLGRQDALAPNPFDKTVIHISESMKKLKILLPRNFSYADISGITINASTLSLTAIDSGLKKLIWSRTGLRNFTHPIRGLELLEELDISHCDVSVISPEFFDTFSGLRHLNLSRTFLRQQFLLDWGLRLLQPLRRLEVIDLSHNDLSYLPVAALPTAKRVYLSNNHFSTVPVDVSNMSSLQEIDLTFNAISILDEAQMAVLDELVSQGRNFSLRLYGNPLACDCSALGFLSWLQSTAVRLDQDGDLPCLTEAKAYSTVGQVLDKLHGKLWRRCVAPFWLVFSGVGLTLLLLLMVLVWMGAKFNSQLQHILLRWLNLGGRERARTDFQYDVYVAYNIEDVPLVYGLLRNQLEGRRGIRLYLKDRELQNEVLPGSDIAEGILVGVKSSWRTLFLLTPNLLQDSWFVFMVAVAIQSLDWRTPGGTMLLLAGLVSKADIPETLLSSVEEEDIFFLPDWCNDDLPMWDQLACRILGRTAATPPRRQ